MMNKTKFTCLISGCVAAAGLAAMLLWTVIRFFMEYNRISSGIGIIGGSNFEAALFTTQITVSSSIPFIVVSLFFIVSLIIFIVTLIKMLSAKKAN